jgi:hypothetical protein
MTDRTTHRPIHLSRTVWIFASLVFLLPWSVVVLLLLRPRAPEVPPPKPVSAAKAAPANGANENHSGPWGRVEFSRIRIEPPEDIVQSPPVKPPRWNFPRATEASLDQLWTKAALTPAERTSLARPAYREVSPAGISLQPDPRLVIDLSPSARLTIYAELARFAENPLHTDPFRFRADDVNDWFEDSGLPESLVATVKRLIYVRAGSAAFSDLEVVLPLAADRATRIRLIKTLSRKTALIGHLILSASDDGDTLARYWGQGRRSKDLAVLLESIATRPGGGTLDLVHLLPPFARLLLYTFPTPSVDPLAAARDCHWTSFNFYAAQPDDRFTALEFVKQTLDRDYYPVSGNPTFGDIILLVQNGNQGVHSCVYVADDVVFTKNGSSFSVPWTLARLDQVIDFYSFTAPVEVLRFRRK